MFRLSRTTVRKLTMCGFLAASSLLAVVLAGSLGKLSPGTALASFGQAGPGDQLTVPIYDMNGSGITGTATLTAEDGFTTIAIEISGPAGSYPTHIHSGSCETFEPMPGFPLSDTIPGEVTQTVVEIPLSRLIDNNYIINIHIPSTDLNVLLTPESRIACGAITAAAAAENEVVEASPTAEGGVGGQTDEAPSAGVGSTFNRGTSMTLIMILGGMVLLFGFAGFKTQRWSRRPVSIDRA